LEESANFSHYLKKSGVKLLDSSNYNCIAALSVLFYVNN